MSKITVTFVAGVWVKGLIDGLEFCAKVYSKPSKMGLNNGRVSILTIRKNKRDVINYSRGWDVMESEYLPLTDELVDFLESRNWRKA